MNTAISEGKFFSVATARRFNHSARHYTGIEKDLKDPVDGARYAIADLLINANRPYRDLRIG